MALAIRLTRGGQKKRPFYRIVVADSRKARDGRFIERLGTYNPMLEKDNPDRVRLVRDRIEYWLGVGARPSDRIARFLADAGIAEKPVINDQPKKSRPKAKAQERLAEQEAAKQAAATQAEEAPTEEAAAGESPDEPPMEVPDEAPVEDDAGEDEEAKN